MPLSSRHEGENGSSQPPVVTDSGPVLYSSSSNLAAGPARYIKGELIGRGACKTVYRAFDEREGMEVAWNEISVNSDALTTLDERAKERIFGEIKLLKQLKHKNVLALYDWWFDKKNSNLVFITELLIDGSLRAYRRRHKNVDVTVLKRWGWQILQGLVYLHGHNPPIIHRDLKSDNIFVNGSSGTLKIGDLGFATFKAGLSSAMSVIGTPEFMAPELYEEKYDEKVDIYSFGLCLLELATLEYPYCECRNAAQIFKKVTQGIPPQGLQRITDTELREFVLLCIRQDPKERPEARVLLKHPFFEAIRLDTSSRSKLSLPHSANSTLTHALPLGSGLTSPAGTRTPTPQAAVANGVIAAAAVVVAAQPPVPEAAAVQPAAPALPTAVHRESDGLVGTDSPQAPSVPAVMATLTAAAAVLAQRDTGTLSNQLSAASALSAAPSSQPPGPSARPSGLVAASGPAQQSLPASGRATQEDVAVAQPALWLGQDSLEKGSALQHDMRIAAAAALTGSTTSTWRGSTGGTHPPAAQSAASSTATAIPPFHQANGHGNGIHPAGVPPLPPMTYPPSHLASTVANKDGSISKTRRGSTTSLNSANGMGEMTEDVLLYDDNSPDGISGRNSSTNTAPPGSAAAYIPGSPFSASENFSPSARLSLQRSKECSLVVDDEDSELGEDEEEGPLCDARLGQRVRLMCRNYHDNLLSFSMSFINNNGTRKKVGFQYDMDADTAAEVAGEMIENLSLNHDEAGYIANLIQKELQRHSTAVAAAPPSAATTTITEITTAHIAGSNSSTLVGSAKGFEVRLEQTLSQQLQQQAAGSSQVPGPQQAAGPQHWGNGPSSSGGPVVMGAAIASSTTTAFTPHTTSALTQGLQAAAGGLRAPPAIMPAALQNAWPTESHGQQGHGGGVAERGHAMHGAHQSAQQEQDPAGEHQAGDVDDDAEEAAEEEPSCFF